MNYDSLIKSSRARAPGAPKGYSPIPGSRAGGYRKKSGGKYAYWYPGGLGHTSEGEAASLGDLTSPVAIKRWLKDVSRSLTHVETVSDRVWTATKHTASEFPATVVALRKIKAGEQLSSDERHAVAATLVIVGTSAMYGAVGGLAVAGGAFVVKFSLHVAMQAIHRYMARTYTAGAGLQLAEALSTYGAILKAMSESDETEAKELIRELVKDIKAVIDELDPEEVARMMEETKGAEA